VGNRSVKDRAERGAALVWVAGSMVALLAMASLAVDLGWYYLNGARLQSTADAAALAGVVHMPNSLIDANADAEVAARLNGFAGATLTGTGLPDNEYQVSLDFDVPMFLAPVIGIETLPLNRVATARNLPPLPLGSPANGFGNECAPGLDGCTGQSNFWANMHGRYTQASFGDAYSSFCTNRNGNATCNRNHTFRERGYLYGIERGTNNGFTVEFLDIAFHNPSGAQNTSDNHRTGDRGCEQWGTTSADCGQTVQVNLYAPDPTPLDISDNPLICTHTWTPRPQVAANAPYVFESPPCFTVASASPGIYVLQVVALPPANAQDSGLNRYSLRVNAGSRLYGLGDFSIYNNSSGTESEFFLAEVRDWYAGKTLVLELFDPGESSQPGTLEIIGPDGTVWNDTNCRIYSRNHSPTSDWSGGTTVMGGCTETVTPNEYNNRWLKFEIPLPSDYSCSYCWWMVNYDYPSAVNDTTTWRAYMIGDPLRLVPNP
jgi:hypothetical protein